MKRRNGFLSAALVSRREVCIETVCPDQHADQERYASHQKAEGRQHYGASNRSHCGEVYRHEPQAELSRRQYSSAR